MQKIIKTGVVLLGIIFLAGCGQGSTIQSPPVAINATGCIDSDSGKNIYARGSATYKDDKGVILHVTEDSCATKNENKQSENEAEYVQGIPSCMGTNCYVLEGYCGEYQGSPIDKKEFIQCLNGCNSGVCNPK